MRIVFLGVLVSLAFAAFTASAQAQTANPQSVAGGVTASGAIAEASEAGKRYRYKSITTYCYAKNILGQKLFQINGKWWWSWWVASGTIKAARHETMYASNLMYGWKYDKSWNGSTISNYPYVTWIRPSVYSQFDFPLGGSYTLVTRPTFYPGQAFPSCARG